MEDRMEAIRQIYIKEVNDYCNFFSCSPNQIKDTTKYFLNQIALLKYENAMLKVTI